MTCGRRILRIRPRCSCSKRFGFGLGHARVAASNSERGVDLNDRNVFFFLQASPFRRIIQVRTKLPWPLDTRETVVLLEREEKSFFHLVFVCVRALGCLKKSLNAWNKKRKINLHLLFFFICRLPKARSLILWSGKCLNFRVRVDIRVMCFVFHFEWMRVHLISWPIFDEIWIRIMVY